LESPPGTKDRVSHKVVLERDKQVILGALCGLPVFGRGRGVGRWKRHSEQTVFLRDQQRIHVNVLVSRREDRVTQVQHAIEAQGFDPLADLGSNGSVSRLAADYLKWHASLPCQKLTLRLGRFQLPPRAKTGK